MLPYGSAALSSIILLLTSHAVARCNQLGDLCHHLVAHSETLVSISRRRIATVTLTLRTSHRSQPVLCLHASMRMPLAQGALHVPALRDSGLHTLRGVSGSACRPMARLLSAVAYYCSPVTPWHAATSSGTYVTIWLLTRKHLFPSRVDGLRLS
eukprot:COSAG01_NODE_759_length_13802_cov_16.155221_17_plen_153_part_01